MTRERTVRIAYVACIISVATALWIGIGLPTVVFVSYRYDFSALAHAAALFGSYAASLTTVHTIARLITRRRRAT